MKNLAYIIIFLVQFSNINNTIISKDAVRPERNDTLTMENLAHYLIETGVENPAMVFRQSMLETGYLTSNLARQHKNLFGMKRPGTWTTRASKVIRNNYLSYQDWRHSVEDYKEYQSRFGTSLTAYSANKHYKKMINKIKIDSEITKIFKESI